ncbi:hypothetical protein D3248_10810 [Leucobacter zeae]|nr:hypothetical protein [Leucobacter zeae]
MKSRLTCTLAALAVCTLGLAACSSSSAPEGSGASAGSSLDGRSTTLLTNYFAQAEQGGYWDMALNDYGEEQGLDIDVQQGGPGINTVPQVASGSYDFGVAQADDIMIARAGGLPVVGLMAPIDKTLFVLMAQKSTGITSFDQIDGHEVAVRQGAPYWDYVTSEFALDDVTPITFHGSMAEFKAKPDLVQQGYATSDVFLAGENGIDINVLSVADDAGYNPYSQVLFTSEAMIEQDPELVQAVVDASIAGWESFIDDPADARKSVLSTNEDTDPEVFDASAKALGSGGWYTSPVGAMTQARWEELGAQLVGIGSVPKDFDASAVWTDEFLARE